MQDAVPALRHVVVLDTDGGAPRRCQVGRRPGGARSPISKAAPASTHPSPDAPADILYTSGTTGTPKGVVTSHDAVLRTAYASALTRAFEDGRRILFSLPCYHMFGYVEGLLSVLYVGGAVIPLTGFSAERYFAGIAAPPGDRHVLRPDDGGGHGRKSDSIGPTTCPR